VQYFASLTAEPCVDTAAAAACLLLSAATGLLCCAPAGLQQFYPDPSVLVGLLVCVAANLKPAKLAGEPSQAMVLAADAEGPGGQPIVKPLQPPGVLLIQRWVADELCVDSCEEARITLVLMRIQTGSRQAGHACEARRPWRPGFNAVPL
jgi:tRNA-binding EMAP/Myf-like protein